MLTNTNDDFPIGQVIRRYPHALLPRRRVCLPQLSVPTR